MKRDIMRVGSDKGDEYYTMDETAEEIACCLNEKIKTVWLPFRDSGGAFERVLNKHGYNTVCTDGDFF